MSSSFIIRRKGEVIANNQEDGNNYIYGARARSKPISFFLDAKSHCGRENMFTQFN